MKIKSQLLLIPREKTKWTHGGGPAKGNARTARPFVRNKWIHLSLKSSKAKGRLSFLMPKNRSILAKLLRQLQKKYGVQIHDFANVGNHLHFKARSSQKENWQNFLRVFTTQFARLITGAKKGKPFGRFWDGLAFSRVLTSTKEILYLKGYFEANRIEAGQGQSERERYLSKFRKWVKTITADEKESTEHESKIRCQSLCLGNGQGKFRARKEVEQIQSAKKGRTNSESKKRCNKFREQKEVQQIQRAKRGATNSKSKKR